jgi:hypothetical protein
MWCRMHGVDKKKEGRPKGALGKNVKWGFPAYANLWVMVHFLAYVYRRANYDYKRCPLERQPKIRPAMQDMFKNWRSIPRRFYEADKMMKKLQREGDKRYAAYENAVVSMVETFERIVVDEGREFDLDDYGF